MKKFVSTILFLAAVSLTITGCQGNSEDPNTLDTEFIYSDCQGVLKNSDGKSLTFDGSTLDGDMNHSIDVVPAEHSPETYVAIPSSKQFVVEPSGDTLNISLALGYKGVSITGKGITKAQLNDGGEVQLTGTIKEPYVSISLPQRFNLGAGLFNVSGVNAEDMHIVPTDTGFDVSGITGAVRLEITSSEYSGVSFMELLEVSASEWSVDLSRYGEGVVVVTDGNNTQEIQF